MRQGSRDLQDAPAVRAVFSAGCDCSSRGSVKEAVTGRKVVEVKRTILPLNVVTASLDRVKPKLPSTKPIDGSYYLPPFAGRSYQSPAAVGTDERSCSTTAFGLQAERQAPHP